MTTPAEKFWWLGAAVSAVAAALVLWFNWGQHWLRAQKMKKPFRLDLVGPPGGAIGGMVNELHAPPDTEFSIQLRIWPLLKFEQHEIIFGFIGDDASRPVPKMAFNEFIKSGKRREQTPDRISRIQTTTSVDLSFRRATAAYIRSDLR